MPLRTLRTSGGVGGNADVLLTPHALDLGRPPCVYMHGAGGNPLAVVDGGVEQALCNLFAARGFSIECVSHGLTFGTDAVTAPTTGLARLSLDDVKSRGRVGSGKKGAGVGVSMGSFELAKTIGRDPSQWDCAVYYLPLFSLQTARDTNVLGLRSTIDGDYSVTYPAALPAGADIDAGMKANMATVPSLVIYSSNDEVSVGNGSFPFNMAQFCVDIGATVVDITGLNGSPAPPGHAFVTDPTAMAALYETILNFVEAHTA